MPRNTRKQDGKGNSKYAVKKQLQREEVYSPRSPFRIVTVTVDEDENGGSA